MPKRYGRWAGHPAGQPEDPARCVIEVPFPGRSMLSRQCGRKRGHGDGALYCAQHAKWSPGKRSFRTPPEILKWDQ